MKHLTTNVKTLERSGGSHIFCSPNLVEKENDEVTGDKVKSGKESLMLCVSWSVQIPQYMMN